MPEENKVYKIINSRTRDVMVMRLTAHSHTEAEQAAKNLFPSTYTVASLLRPGADETPVTKKKRTKKR